MIKVEWRKKMKQKLESMNENDRITKSKEIAAYLYKTEKWIKSKCIGITVSRKFELDTLPIIKKAWSEGKTVCVPKCYSREKNMEFRELRSFDELENVYMDLYEPSLNKTEVCASNKIDLLIVPGLVFDSAGFRIGYGGGYYDRYLQHYNGSTVSLAYSFQTEKQLPREEFDIPVEHIITELGHFK
ncbi:5-formyltetrahydrofolate cyclo-ligase [Fictibacillus nanhaiensis]|uniref:5-formyltetrahydrofolate cyclo-ligase n=1 Tax=Fictibacillus nanhaiensis TaxID=742169 RepID=UPI001C945ED4|nr:5-formyltetrahydrofolate cyclo-ligase [Fictibacillus nanhaiensis]MBY6035497.1 5-formyltetrahydrofolate cyclo-ligase [Fictibacillus nanhaiensis]